MYDGSEDITAEKVDRWWHAIRPYWHILSFIVIVTTVVVTNWTKVSAYDGRITALEVGQATTQAEQNRQGQDIAVMKQQVNDIHDYLIPRRQ